MIAPEGRIGILGGGQLARMLALAAARYGLSTHIYAPELDSSAFDVTRHTTIADYDNAEALEAFARSVDVVTYEFENVPAETARIVSSFAPLRPGARALAVSQDRLSEKTFIANLGLPLAPFAAVDNLAMLEDALLRVGRPAVLKTRRLGYDGKGQAKIMPGDDAATALAAIGNAPAILEGFVNFAYEVSVIAARGLNGDVAIYDVCQNDHHDHILATTRVPARLSPAAHKRALEKARTIIDALDYVGVLTVEMFVVEGASGEQLVINEIAPRVHNSGHWTIEGADTSQFEQHIRAICGWPLGSTRRRGDVMMTNLIGADSEEWAAIAAESGAHLHLYGKGEARAARKMGHITRITPMFTRITPK
jgi:5-(carboxyamino)imidazole ribonucleotide synthase